MTKSISNRVLVALAEYLSLCGGDVKLKRYLGGGMMQHPPYIIDFAKVRIDRPPDFSPEVLEESERQGREQFEHHWPEVKSLLATLETYQIYYLDPRRGNITFPDMP